MAESSPLSNSKAHAHARRATEQMERSDWQQAAAEHGHAAADYAQAARSTHDSEALRVLKLLEDEHAKLSRIINSQANPDPRPMPSVESAQTEPIAVKPDSPTSENAIRSRQTKPSTTSLATTRVGSQFRDSSPSLARDMASRRGILSANTTPPSAAAQARARQPSPEAHRGNRTAPSRKIPPSVVQSQANLTARPDDDDAFEKFFTNLTTGTMSKLSSVLAYAGLPLTADAAQSDQSSGSRSKSDSRTVQAQGDPDVKKIFSPAALDAIDDSGRRRGRPAHAFGPTESFYVVQKGGGTYSYADIAKAQSQFPDGGVDEEDEEAFVDAREAQLPPSAPPGRGASKPERARDGRPPRTHEELELENVTLKQTLEQVAQRLSEFETHAQDASMAALTQSMVSLHNHTGAAGTHDPVLLDRIKALEQQVKQQNDETLKLQTEMEKKDKTIRKYTSKWDEIKKSAKQKDKARREKAEKGGDDAPSPVTAAE